MNLPELIKRVESATGPNYALECDLFAALDLPTEWFGSKVVGHFLRNGYVGFNTADGFMHLDCIKPRPYTASLDAALALAERVLPGWTWSLMSPDPGFGIPLAEAQLVPGNSFDGGVKANAPTPALALVLAVLRAYSAESAAASPSGFAAGAAQKKSEEG